MSKGKGRPAYRRAEVRAYVEETIARDGVAPSYGMICARLGIRTRGEVCRIVTGLEDAGVLRRVGAGKVRRLRLNFANYSPAAA